MDESVERGLDWANLLVVATVARLLCQNRHRDCAHSTGYGPTPGTLSGWSYCARHPHFGAQMSTPRHHGS